MATVSWSEEKILKLIKLYEAKDFLYNIRSKDYHNRNKKNSALEEIAKELAYSVQEVSKRLRYMRKNFTDERRKMRKLCSGQGLDEMYVSKWKYFSALSFLEEHLSSSLAQTTSNLELSFRELENCGASTSQQKDDAEELMPSTSSNTVIAQPLSSLLNARRKSIKRDRENSGADVSLDFMQKYFQRKLMKKEEAPRQPLNDESNFGVTVATEVLRIKDTAVRTDLKKQIMSAIYDAQIKDIDRQNTVIQGVQYVLHSNGNLYPMATDDFSVYN